jgi:hypothetical protein
METYRGNCIPNVAERQLLCVLGAGVATRPPPHVPQEEIKETEAQGTCKWLGECLLRCLWARGEVTDINTFSAVHTLASLPKEPAPIGDSAG